MSEAISAWTIVPCDRSPAHPRADNHAPVFHRAVAHAVPLCAGTGGALCRKILKYLSEDLDAVVSSSGLPGAGDR